MIEISIYLRVLLVLGSISTAAFILKRIRQAKADKRKINNAKEQMNHIEIPPDL